MKVYFLEPIKVVVLRNEDNNIQTPVKVVYSQNYFGSLAPHFTIYTYTLRTSLDPVINEKSAHTHNNTSYSFSVQTHTKLKKREEN